jgi:VanZ family protein
MSRYTITKALLVIYVTLVVLLSVVPFSTPGTAFNDIHVLSLRLDYLLHLLVFIPVVPLWLHSWPAHPAWLVVALGLGLAAAAEGIHYFVPYRSYNVNDLLGNIMGVLLGAALMLLINRLLTKRRFVKHTGQ